MQATSPMTELQAWSFLVGILMPMAVSIIQQPGWSDRLRSVVSVGLCIVAGVVTVEIEHDLHIDEHLWVSLATIVIAAQTTYRNFWKPTGVAPAIEAKTSPHAH